MNPCTFDLVEGPALLARTPRVLDTLLRGLPVAWLECDEGPDSFSPRAVVGHLIHGEETDWIPRARQILDSGETRAFTPYDRFAQARRFAGRTTDELLDLFAQRRGANLGLLASWELDAAKLALTGVHPDFGRVTLGQLLAAWVVHDQGHVAQALRVMAKRHIEAVGPWRGYLPILNR